MRKFLFTMLLVFCTIGLTENASAQEEGEVQCAAIGCSPCDYVDYPEMWPEDQPPPSEEELAECHDDSSPPPPESQGCMEYHPVDCPMPECNAETSEIPCSYEAPIPTVVEEPTSEDLGADDTAVVVERSITTTPEPEDVEVLARTGIKDTLWIYGVSLIFFGSAFITFGKKLKPLL